MVERGITRPITVLLVDDDRADVKAVQRAFTRQKLVNPIVVAKDGLEALAKLRGSDGHEKVDRPCIVLLDLNMPRMNGIEFLDELRQDEALRRTIVFVLTTSNQDRDRAAAYDRHVAGYVLKSRVGTDFVELLTMLDPYWKIVEMPP